MQGRHKKRGLRGGSVATRVMRAYLSIHVLYQLSGAVHEIPDHLRKLLDALRLALLRCGRIVGKGGGRRRVSRFRRLERVDLAARLEDCAACSVQHHACLDAGFPNEATKLLLEGVVPVCLETAH